MAWSVAQAKQQLSVVLRRAATEPQLIENRSRPVAAVVDAKTYREFEAWRAERHGRSVGMAFADLRAITRSSSYRLPVPRRVNRRDEFLPPRS